MNSTCFNFIPDRGGTDALQLDLKAESGKTFVAHVRKHLDKNVVDLLNLWIPSSIRLFAPRAPETKVSLHFEIKTSDPPLRIIVPVRKDLFGTRVRAGTGLTATDRAEYCNSCMETSLRNRELAWTLRRLGLLGVVNFTDDQE